LKFDRIQSNISKEQKRNRKGIGVVGLQNAGGQQTIIIVIRHNV